jgi:hypothetical protein
MGFVSCASPSGERVEIAKWLTDRSPQKFNLFDLFPFLPD